MGILKTVLDVLVPEPEVRDTSPHSTAFEWRQYERTDKALTIRGRNDIARQELIDEGATCPSVTAIITRREELFGS